ncbi:MAG: TPM domain-containing protein, partial [Noviherbaspirillum sp.]
MALRSFIGLVFALLLMAAGAQDFVQVPPLQARVTDKAGMLDANQRATLENVLKEYEDRTGSQIAILLISKTSPEAIEQYSIR